MYFPNYECRNTPVILQNPETILSQRETQITGGCGHGTDRDSQLPRS